MAVLCSGTSCCWARPISSRIKASSRLGIGNCAFVVLCVAGGALLGIAPFLLEYDALVKVAEAGALNTVVARTEEPRGHCQPDQRRDRQVAGRARAGRQDRHRGQGNRGAHDQGSAGVHGIHAARQRQRAGHAAARSGEVAPRGSRLAAGAGADARSCVRAAPGCVAVRAAEAGRAGGQFPEWPAATPRAASG